MAFSFSSKIDNTQYYGLVRALEIKKQECEFLHREILALQAQSAGGTEFKELETKNHNLEKANAELREKVKENKYELLQMKEELRIYKKRSERLQKEVDSLELTKNQLKAENSVNKLELKDKDDQLAKYKNQILKDHTNSSIPSSSETIFKKKIIQNSRVKTGKKPGGQPGHKGHKRKPCTQKADKTINIEDEKAVKDNPVWVYTGNNITHKVLNISVKYEVTDYVVKVFRNTETGKLKHAKFPLEAQNEVNFGSSINSLLLYLVNYCNISIDKARDLIKNLSNGVIDISKGKVASLSKDFVIRSVPELQNIWNKLKNSDVLYTDFTGSRVNGNNKNVLVCTNKDETLLFFRDKKGHDGVKGSPLETTKAVIVSDHDLTFYNYGSDHQECLAHILRYLLGAAELEKHLTWHKAMHSLLQEMIHVTNENNKKLSKPVILDFEKRYNDILLIAEKEYEANPPSRYLKDGFNLYKRLKKYIISTLFFLRNPNVDATNNISEKYLRNYKRKYVQMGSGRSFESQSFLCNVLSMFLTWKSNGKNIYDNTCRVFEKSIPPGLRKTDFNSSSIYSALPLIG